MGIKDFLYGVMIKKGIRVLVKVIISYILSVKVATYLQSIGVTIDIQTMEAGLTASFASLAEMLRNYLKQKHDLKIF